MKNGYLYILCIIVALLMTVNTHLKTSFADSVFRAIGISPWSNGNNLGFHFPGLIGLILIIIGFIGTVRIYKPKYPKIVSRLMIGGIAFVLIFPYVTEGVMFLVKRNSTSIDSINISNSQCRYESSEEKVEANCKFTIFNYGNVNVISIKPMITHGINEEIEFESGTLSLDKHSSFNVNIPFSGINKSKNTFSGSIKGPFLEFEVLVKS